MALTRHAQSRGKRELQRSFHRAGTGVKSAFRLRLEAFGRMLGLL